MQGQLVQQRAAAEEQRKHQQTRYMELELACKGLQAQIQGLNTEKAGLQQSNGDLEREVRRQQALASVEGLVVRRI